MLCVKSNFFKPHSILQMQQVKMIMSEVDQYARKTTTFPITFDFTTQSDIPVSDLSSFGSVVRLILFADWCISDGHSPIKLLCFSNKYESNAE